MWKQKKKLIKRPGDLAPQGIRSTIKGDYDFNEISEQIQKTKFEIIVKKLVQW